MLRGRGGKQKGRGSRRAEEGGEESAGCHGTRQEGTAPAAPSGSHGGGEGAEMREEVCIACGEVGCACVALEESLDWAVDRHHGGARRVTISLSRAAVLDQPRSLSLYDDLVPLGLKALDVLVSSLAAILAADGDAPAPGGFATHSAGSAAGLSGGRRSSGPREEGGGHASFYGAGSCEQEGATAAAACLGDEGGFASRPCVAGGKAGEFDEQENRNRCAGGETRALEQLVREMMHSSQAFASLSSSFLESASLNPDGSRASSLASTSTPTPPAGSAPAASALAPRQGGDGGIAVQEGCVSRDEASDHQAGPQTTAREHSSQYSVGGAGNASAAVPRPRASASALGSDVSQHSLHNSGVATPGGRGRGEDLLGETISPPEARPAASTAVGGLGETDEGGRDERSWPGVEDEGMEEGAQGCGHDGSDNRAAASLRVCCKRVGGCGV